MESSLLTYRYHQDCETFSVKRYNHLYIACRTYSRKFCCRETIWDLRVEALQSHVLSKWSHFTIWNAGKQGRRLYRSLRPENQAKVRTCFADFKLLLQLKVVAFCDVDQKKIEQGFYTYEESEVACSTIARQIILLHDVVCR